MELAIFLLCLIVVAMTILQVYERNEWRKERAELIQRLQVPESATLAYAREHEGKPEPVPTLALDDDEGYEALRLRREGSVLD